MNHNPVGWFEIYVQDMGQAKRCCGQINLDTLLSPFSNSIGVISPIVV